MRDHPIFRNEHNAGQVTTAHRPVEAARQQAYREGMHPDYGRFQRSFPQTLEEWREYDPNKKKFVGPSGAVVTVQHHEAPEGTKPHDRKISVNGQEMFESAAREYLGIRHGIRI